LCGGVQRREVLVMKQEIDVMTMAQNAQRVLKREHSVGGSDANHICTCMLPDELERFAALVRNAALEEAAARCETYEMIVADVRDVADVIRAMKEPT
jgi:hypothetical protein